MRVSKGTIVWDGGDITALKPADSARRGIAYVPQGREIFPLLTVEENLETGFAPLKRADRSIPDEVFTLFPGAQRACCGGAAATSRAASSSSLQSAARW